MKASWRTAPLALLTCLALSGCDAFKASETALCTLSAQPREDLLAGLIAHPETPPAVDLPAQDLLIVLTVCPR